MVTLSSFRTVMLWTPLPKWLRRLCSVQVAMSLFYCFSEKLLLIKMKAGYEARRESLHGVGCVEFLRALQLPSGSPQNFKPRLRVPLRAWTPRGTAGLEGESRPGCNGSSFSLSLVIGVAVGAGRADSPPAVGLSECVLPVSCGSQEGQRQPSL